MCLLDSAQEYREQLTSLDETEITRYERFLCRDAARQFLAGRALARTALSYYTNVPESAWRFAVNEHGRPAIDEPRSQRGIHFNLSHTSGAAVLAVGRIPEVGIDVETIDRPVDIVGIGRCVFTQAENSWIAMAPEGSEHHRFFDLWTLKEAYVKARGRGFSLRPNSFELAKVGDRFRLRCSPDHDPNPERWRFYLSSPHPNLRMALAIDSRSRPCIKMREYCLSTGCFFRTE